MSKKLKKVAAWVLSYVIYAFTLYGSSVVKLTAIGNMVLWLIAAYAVAKILLNALGRRDTMLHMVLNTVWTAVIAVFLTLVFKHFLSLEGSLWASLLSNLEEVILAKNSQLRKVALMGVLYSLCFYISIQISAKAISKQMVKRSIGVRVALICMFVFLVLAAVFNFCMFKNIYDKITFGDWRKMEGNKMIIRSVVYGLIGFVLAIVTPFVTQIGKPQTKEEETSVQ